MNAWVNRIKTRMQELGMTQEELASKLGITRGAVTHYLAGRRVPPLRQFQRLATVLKADPAWLQFGDAKRLVTAAKKTKQEAIQTTRYPIPILTGQQAIELRHMSTIDRNAIKTRVPHLYTDNDRWYAFTVTGDSMTAPSGRKSFHEGDIVIIDPDATPANGNFVIALLPKSKEPIFKQYVTDGGTSYLKPLNPQYPLIQIDHKTVICGVMVYCLH